MLNKNSQQNSQSIPFWRRRWFWAAAMGAVIISIFSFYFNNWQWEWSKFLFSLYRLPSGFINVLLMFLPTSQQIILSNKIFHPPIYYFFILIYYSIILLLFYKIVINKKVKIKYPILFLIFIISSICGVILIDLLSTM